uniref:G protein-coupled receptor 141 n=1 Tax=Amphilophus citrinellus TaxID=61819 RepID=A0A3Q0QV46_AMPCI
MTIASTKDKPLNNTNYHIALLVIYSVVLICGTISLSLMMRIMKSSTTSTMSIAVLNLIFTHFIFLLTVPFRIYYYATNEWTMHYGWCKIVSSMIHIHMYMSFVLYVIILISRLLTFYHRACHVASFQRIHAIFISVLVWIILLIAVPCIIHYKYGDLKNGSSIENNACFQFGKNIESAKVFNYITSILIIVIATVLTAFQGNVLWVLYRTHREGCTSQQEFGAQLKSLCFALIMVICFIPYHIFRLYYLEHIDDLQSLNEMLLSLTTFNCLDMLTFLGTRTCNICFSGKPLCTRPNC